jgi:hypothetical protein
VKHNKTFYRLNRDHPLLKRAVESTSNRSALNALLRLAEETVPFPHITIQNSEHPESLPAPFEGASPGQVREVMRQVLTTLLDTGHTHAQAMRLLATIHPFGAFPELLQTLSEEQADD